MTKIVTTPATVLSEKAKPVKKVNKEVRQIIANMKSALNSASDPIGVGLAAPQIGISLRIFITKPMINSTIQTFINPQIIASKDPRPEPKIAPKGKKKNKEVKLEGCLSLPSIWGEVKRKPSITISYLDEDGNKKTNTYKGLMAIIVQHEIDHLNGVLFPKHVLIQKGILYKSKRNEKGEDIFEEINI